MSTFRSMDPMGMLQIVSMSLRDPIVSQLPALMFGPMDPIEKFGGVSEWLHDAGKCDLDPITSTAGSMDPIEMFWVVSAWLCGMGTTVVFCIAIYAWMINLHHIQGVAARSDPMEMGGWPDEAVGMNLIHPHHRMGPMTLLWRFDGMSGGCIVCACHRHSIFSMVTFTSSGSIQIIYGSDRWLRSLCEFDSPTLPLTSNTSVWAVCGRCFDSYRIDATAASCVITVTVITILVTITVASPLIKLSHRQHLITTLNSSKDEVLTRGCDLHIQYAQALQFWPSQPSVCMVDVFVVSLQAFGLSGNQFALGLVILMPIRTLGASVSKLDMSVWLLKSFSSFRANLAPLPGFNTFVSALGMSIDQVDRPKVRSSAVSVT
ncbi:hypothetical protein SCLCIDRAFT_28531 [Scleroderma citrinum Foug A]|uniref:Uncharacterized protein n=1 Tax=Scleroderma citrinum Foug A TaxID=1036808 RepID=A0A0C3DAY8_9AGAM|nr:hypothetical protein SCLCIDRAFT_28579 [Scleroderma citrinum Foug A]KIM57900.1 hypothetical protein SCLCIDRAFT_28531 [Scleroderma citrinum Foug A]